LLGGTFGDEGLAIKVDGAGNAFVTGGTSSGGAPPAGFPVTAGFDNFTGATQAFLTKLDPLGAVILFSRSVPTGTLNSVSRDAGPAPPSVSTSIGLDAVGNVYVSGSETRAAPSASRLTDAFVIVFDQAFASLIPEFFVGGTGDDLGLALAVDAAGNVFLAGETTSADFPFTRGVVQVALGGGVDACAAKVVTEVTISGGGGHASGGGGCFIATAAFGSPIAREVDTLRTFRDRVLVPHAGGRAVVTAYYRVSPSFAGVVARHESLKVVTRAVLRPIIWTAQVALVRPSLAFVVLIGVASALVALLAAVVLVSYCGVGRRRAAVITFTTAAAFAVAIGVLDRAAHQSSRPSVQADVDVIRATPQATGLGRRVVRRPAAGVGTSEPERYDIDVRSFADWPPPTSALKIRPTFSYGRFGYTIESELVDAILTADGLTITNPKHATAVGIEMDDKILTVNGHRPAGGVFMAVLNMRRDPDNNTIEVQLDRRGTIMQRTLVLH
jgi:hypothetical protein